MFCNFKTMSNFFLSSLRIARIVYFLPELVSKAYNDFCNGREYLFCVNLNRTSVRVTSENYLPYERKTLSFFY
jgi:hypothetical protein